MSIKPLIILPDPLLRQVSKPVERVDSHLLKFAGDMLDTMYDAPGIGLAAIQVGEPLRLIVIDIAKEDEPPAPQIFFNPEIVATGAWRWEGFGFTVPVELPGPGEPRCTDVDGDGHLDPYLDRSAP